MWGICTLRGWVARLRPWESRALVGGRSLGAVESLGESEVSSHEAKGTYVLVEDVSTSETSDIIPSRPQIRMI